MSGVRTSIDEELEALGEAPRTDDERALEEPLEDEDTQAVGALFAAASERPVRESAPLSVLEQRRVWREISKRLDAAPSHGVAPRPAWHWLAMAVAASLLLVVAWPSSGPSPRTSQQATRALGEQARRAVDRLPGPQREARARALAETFAQQLRLRDSSAEARGERG